MSSPQDKVSPQHNASYTEDAEGSSQPPATVNKDSSDVKEKEPDDGEKHYYSSIKAGREFLKRNPPTPQGVFNLAVMISTVLLTFITKWQYDVQILDQRAWIGPSKVHKADMVPDTDMSFCVEVTNSGRTPATRFKGLISGLMQSTGVPLSPVYEYGSPTNPMTSVGTLFPGSSICLETVPMKFPPVAIEFLKSGSGTLYVYGRLEYDDVFGTSHCTMFCVFLKRDLSNFATCSTYNETTDTKCEE